MPVCRGGITPVCSTLRRLGSPWIQPALCSFLPCLLVRHQSGAGLADLPCQGGAATLFFQPTTVFNSTAYASSAESTVSSRVLRSVDSRGSAVTKLLTPAYRILALAVVSFWQRQRGRRQKTASPWWGEPAPIGSRNPAASTDCIPTSRWR